MTQTLQVPCATWCAYQDDPDYFDEPGNCLGEILETPLSLHDRITKFDPDGSPDVCTVYAVRRPGQPDVVYLAHNVLPGMELTPAEARQVIEHMQLVLGQIEAS